MKKVILLETHDDTLRAYKMLPCQLGEYLGKSKANINDLFEVRDD